MHFEVEQKYPLANPAAIESRLQALGARQQLTCTQVDQYFNHPARDFANTDEALRLRQIGETNLITYKGPKLDPHSKTRRELELPLPTGATTKAGFAELLAALGFRPVAEVRKRRRTFQLFWQEHEVEIALDQVESLGTFLEIEITADENTLAAAKHSLATLAAELGLPNNERRSYLELLLDK